MDAATAGLTTVISNRSVLKELPRPKAHARQPARLVTGGKIFRHRARFVTDVRYPSQPPTRAGYGSMLRTRSRPTGRPSRHPPCFSPPSGGISMRKYGTISFNVERLDDRCAPSSLQGVAGGVAPVTPAMAAAQASTPKD